MNDEAVYKCSYCGKRYQREDAFIKHKCKQMIREEGLRTPVGQAAWRFYQDWMRFQHKRVPDDRTFLNSRYYNSFMKFANFVKQTDLPTPEKFIKLMIKENYHPPMWLIDEIYVIYLEHLDKTRSPSDHVTITFHTLAKISDEYGCNISKIFEEISSSQLIELIKQRKLSPFVLLASKKFSRFLVKTSKENKEQFIILTRLIRVDHWKKYIERHKKMFDTIKRHVTEMDL